MFSRFLSNMELKLLEEVLSDSNYIINMQSELNGFERNDIWYLVDQTTHQNVINLKYVFKNKMDEKQYCS